MNKTWKAKIAGIKYSLDTYKPRDKSEIPPSKNDKNDKNDKKERGGWISHVGNVIRDLFEVYKLNIIEILDAGSAKRRDSERWGALQFSDFLLNVDLFMEYWMQRWRRCRNAKRGKFKSTPVALRNFSRATPNPWIIRGFLPNHEKSISFRYMNKI